MGNVIQALRGETMTTNRIESDSETSDRQPATIYVVNAPLHSGQPVVLHGAGGNERLAVESK